ncbi:hypothetical protein KP509_18G006300 [Ceratopteris richardii]|nr:hypothetical protein KP509_18G006300 [Ceratopteris richardii]
MKTLGWPPNFVARCPVRLFEAASGSNVWAPSGTAGEFHMKPLGNAVLHFQLRDLLDNQILFEHTMRKPNAFIVSACRFFVIQLENGSFRGFGFSEKEAAIEMKRQVQKAVRPFCIQDYSEESVLNDTVALDRKDSVKDTSVGQTSSSGTTATPVMSYESVPRRSSKRRQSSEDKSASGPPLEITFLNAAPRTSMPQSKWKIVLKSLSSLSRIKRFSAISEILGRHEHEMEIGYPTDVKHVAHIGWDGPSVGGPNWIDELKPAPDFSSGPLREFGQPRGPDWIHDAASAAKWTTSGVGGMMPNMPPKPPLEFLDFDKVHMNKKRNKWKVFG